MQDGALTLICSGLFFAVGLGVVGCVKPELFRGPGEVVRERGTQALKLVGFLAFVAACVGVVWAAASGIRWLWQHPLF